MASIHKLIRCNDCFNTDNNKVTPCRNTIYKSLHEVQCVKCNSIWLICAVHGLRFKFRKYYLAKKHVQQVDHQSILHNAHLLKQFTTCQYTTDNNELNVTSNDTGKQSNFFVNTSNTLDGDFSAVIDSNTSDCTVSSELSKFLASQQPVNVMNYNTRMRRYIERESVTQGSGLKHIIACAFAMNHNAASMSITVPEALFHLKATLFCYQLTSSQNFQFASLCDIMSTTFFTSLNNDANQLQTSPPVSS